MSSYITMPTKRAEFAAAMLPSVVRDVLLAYPKRAFLAGGALRAWSAGEEIKDYDLFFCPTVNVAEAVAAAVPGELARLTTENAITVAVSGCKPIQFVTRFGGSTAEEVIDRFDFTICQLALWHDGSQWCLTAGDTAIADIAAKTLVFRREARSMWPGALVYRVLKFVARGYKISAHEMAQVLAAVFQGKFVPSPTTEALEDVLTSDYIEQAPEVQA